jgi:hypothetical protein
MSNFASEEDLLRYFTIEPRRNYSFQSIFRIYLLNEGCLEKGNLLFDRRGDSVFLKRLSLAGKSVDHYTFKKFFYETADFSMNYEAYGEKKNIKFKVRLVGERIGGSLACSDLGLLSDMATQSFADSFSKVLERKSSLAIENIASQIGERFSNEIKMRMAHEIVEECTPDGKEAFPLSTVFDKLVFAYMKNEEKDYYNEITYFFRFPERLMKVRELDIFCCSIDGLKSSVYYIYNDRRSSRYSLVSPFLFPIKINSRPIVSIKAPSIRPINIPIPYASASVPVSSRPVVVPMPTPKKLPSAVAEHVGPSGIRSSKGSFLKRMQPVKRVNANRANNTSNENNWLEMENFKRNIMKYAPNDNEMEKDVNFKRNIMKYAPNDNEMEKDVNFKRNIMKYAQNNDEMEKSMNFRMLTRKNTKGGRRRTQRK